MSKSLVVSESYEALRRKAGLLDLSSSGKFAIRGNDAARFLHNMLTNDITSLQVGEGCHALKVSVQGKMEAMLRVLRLEEEICCDLDLHALEGVLAELRRRVVLEDAALQEVSETWSLLSLQGPASGEVLRRLGHDPASLQRLHQHAPGTVAGVSVRIIRSDHTGEGGFDLWLPAAESHALSAAVIAAGAHSVDRTVFNVRRIESGIPWHAREVTPEHFPQEAGLDAGWISYTKGCYLGQETIARLHHLGHVNRLLRGLVVETGGLPAMGEVVRIGDKNVGVVTSAVHSLGLDRPIALAYLRREQAEPGTEVLVGEAEARVVALPFL